MVYCNVLPSLKLQAGSFDNNNIRHPERSEEISKCDQKYKSNPSGSCAALMCRSYLKERSEGKNEGFQDFLLITHNKTICRLKK